jgi:tetratricopeptide (TPR) repeat protein
LIEALRQPRLSVLQEVGAVLFAAGHLDVAETVCNALLDKPGGGAWAASRLARIAARRDGPQAAAAAWRDCLDRFPDRIQPYWLTELAHAERHCGREAAAEAVLRQCRERFPTFAPAAAQLAALLANSNKDEQAVAGWRDAFREFEVEAQPWWYLGAAAALRRLGRQQEGEAILDDLAERFPDAPEVLARRAQSAASREEWNRALECWAECIARHPVTARPEWFNGRAKALFRLWRVDEALDEWSSLIVRFPDFPQARVELAQAAQELGEWERAAELWGDLIERFADRVVPNWLAARARCLLNQRLDDPRVAEQYRSTVEALETRYPDSPLGSEIEIAYARVKKWELGEIAGIVEKASGRFPEHRFLLLQWVRVLLALGRLADAEQAAQQLEAGGDDHHAAIGRWLVAIDRGGEAAIIESVHRVVAFRSWAPDAALTLGHCLLDISSAWSAALTLSLMDELGRRYPGRIAIACITARALVTLRRDDEAQALIASVPVAFRSREISELRAWAHARRGEHDMACRLWQSILARHYLPAAHAPEPNLELLTPERSLPEPAGVTVFVPLRNEMANLPEFLRHYRGLGVRGFVVVDHMSSDGSDAYLSDQPDVVLYRTCDSRPAAESGMRWINALIERHGRAGWCLFADADEAFVYPGCESAPLDHFTEYLDCEGAEGVAAFMLDVFPEQLFGAAGEPTTHAACRYYDDDYVWAGHVRSPYSRPLGGVRTRLFGAGEYLHKVPLIKCGRGAHINPHETTHLRLASVTGALLHYKLLAVGTTARNPSVSGRIIEVMQRYQRYASRVAALEGVDLRLPGVSRPLADTLTMANRGLMRAPQEYRRWLEEHTARS